MSVSSEDRHFASLNRIFAMGTEHSKWSHLSASLFRLPVRGRKTIICVRKKSYICEVRNILEPPCHCHTKGNRLVLSLAFGLTLFPPNSQCRRHTGKPPRSEMWHCSVETGTAGGRYTPKIFKWCPRAQSTTDQVCEKLWSGGRPMTMRSCPTTPQKWARRR